MRLHIYNLTGVLALVISTGAVAQARPATKPPMGPAAPAMQAPRGPALSRPTTPAETSTTPPTTAPDEATPQSAAPGQTEATPGQSQTTPGEASQLTPDQTGQTPSGQSVPDQSSGQAQAGQVTAATRADLKAGSTVYDQKGGTIGKIVSMSAKGAVVDTGTVKATIPASSFGKSDKGLVIGMTKAQIDAAAKQVTKKPK